MNIVVIDGQGGGVGRALVEQLKKALPDQTVLAVGANALATSAMLRAGADGGATGENAVAVCCREADVILVPIGIALADALLGEITPRMAQAVANSRALKVLVPVGRCRVKVAGTADLPLSAATEDAVRIAARHILEKDIQR